MELSDFRVPDYHAGVLQYKIGVLRFGVRLVSGLADELVLLALVTKRLSIEPYPKVSLQLALSKG